jgi:hypothetical protein
MQQFGENGISVFIFPFALHYRKDSAISHYLKLQHGPLADAFASIF